MSRLTKRAHEHEQQVQQEEVSGVHQLSVDTIRNRRASLGELSSRLKLVSSQARALVEESADDLEPCLEANGNGVVLADNGAELHMPFTKMEAKLVEMSTLIQQMADPVQLALEEIHDMRRSRRRALSAFIFVLLLNAITSIYVAIESGRLVDRVEVLQHEFKGHLVDAGVREARLSMLIQLAAEHASSDDVREKLEKLEKLGDEAEKK